MTKAEVDQIRQDNNNIEVKYLFEDAEGDQDRAIPNPITSFEHAFEVSKL